MAPSASTDEYESLYLGYWGKPTATIEWCEKNYEVTVYIAEFWNTLTNLVLIVSPFFGLYQCKRYGLEARFILFYLQLLSVGIGSWLFHMTLKYETQLLDELPMLFGTATGIYIMLQRDKPRGSSNPLLISGLVLYCAIVVALYLWSNQPIFQQIMFCSAVALLMVLSIKVSRTHRELGKTFLACASLFLGGSVFWTADRYLCFQLSTVREAVSGYYVLAPLLQFHGWWHIGSMTSCYCYAVVLSYVRLKYLYQSQGDETKTVSFNLLTVRVRERSYRVVEGKENANMQTLKKK